MENRQRLAILWKLIQLLHDTGKTRLQKLLYLLQEVEKVPLGYSYRMHHYGPYSIDLENDLADLTWKGYVNVTTDPEGYGYHVEPGSEGPDDVNDLVTQYGGEMETLLRDFGSRDRATLELVATIHFVNSILGAPEKDILVREVQLLKPQFTQKAVEGKTEEMQKLGIL